MSHSAMARSAGLERGAYRYQRHRPEQTLLYQIAEQHYTAHLAERGIELPGYVQDEFEAYLTCGRLEHGFLRVRRESCHAVKVIACIENPIVIKKILGHLKERASPARTNLLPEGRAPPQGELFG